MKRDAGGDPATDTGKPFKIDLRAKWLALGAMSCDRDLSAGALAVAHVLLDLTNPQTGLAFPGIEYLAERTGLSPRAAERAIVQLTGRGWFAIAREGGGRHRSNRYAFMRWETVSPTTGFDAETPARMVGNPGANRQKTPARTTGESFKESISESEQRKLRVFGKVEGGKTAAAPPAAKPLSPGDRVSAALDKTGWAAFHRAIPKPLIVIGQANVLEAQRAGEGVAMIRDMLAEATRAKAAGGAA